MENNKQQNIREITYRAFLLYGLIGGVCLINLLSYMETVKFNKELKKQCRLSRKMLYKKNNNLKPEF